MSDPLSTLLLAPSLANLKDVVIDATLKGIPGSVAAFPLVDAGKQNWNVLREDLPLPLAVLKQSALSHNSHWMRRFLELSDAVLAPHGKTTMSPQLFQQQLDDGAWAITLANISQVQVARSFGIQRILLANQLIGKQAIHYVLDELRRDSAFEFLCLVDSLEGVQMLAEAAKQNPAGRPLEVLLEGGVSGGRTGCRTVAEALAVARAVKQAEPLLTLRGVEGFEGLIGGPDHELNEARVSVFLDHLCEITQQCADADLLADEGTIILSAGGSAYYDLVAERFAQVQLDREIKRVIRSGCYLTHDSVMYKKAFQRLIERTPQAQNLGEGLQPALEVWAYVQSRPEPTRVLLTLGKRDCSYDAGLPAPFAWFRPDIHTQPLALADTHKPVDINDQHAFLDVPVDSPLQVGDMVACGISHPCLTFDKWQVIPVVDDDYSVVSMIKTYF